MSGVKNIEEVGDVDDVIIDYWTVSTVSVFIGRLGKGTS